MLTCKRWFQVWIWVFLHLTVSANQNELRSMVTFTYYIAECNIVKLSCFAEIQKYVKEIGSKL